ncbi:MAG: hypothetical protein H7318_17535 [Oligoflexus sp.]|nr:hypothetical protein [Oligoflexus sp.]
MGWCWEFDGRTVLVAVAIFLAIEIQSLLVGERADPAIENYIQKMVEDDPCIDKLLNLITVQQGPGEVMVAMKLELQADLLTADLCAKINLFEKRLKEARPEIRWCFVKPDIEV